MHSNSKLLKNKKSGSIIIYVSVFMYFLILCFSYIAYLQCNEYKVLCHEVNYSKKQLLLYNNEQILLSHLYQKINEKRIEIENSNSKDENDILVLLNNYFYEIKLEENEYIILTLKDKIVEIKHRQYNLNYYVNSYSIKIGKNKLLITKTNKK